MPFLYKYKDLQTFSQCALGRLATLSSHIQHLPIQDRNAFELIHEMLDRVSKCKTNIGAFYELYKAQDLFLPHPYVAACLSQRIKIEEGGLEAIRQTEADSLLLQFIHILLQAFIHQEVNLNFGVGGFLIKNEVRRGLKCPSDCELDDFLLEYMKTKCFIVDEVIKETLLAREQAFQASIELIHEMSVILKPLRSLSPFGEFREALSLLEASVTPDEKQEPNFSISRDSFSVIGRASDLFSEVEEIFCRHCDNPIVSSFSEEQKLILDANFENIIEELFHHVSNLIVIADPDALEKNAIKFIQYENKLRQAFSEYVDDDKTAGSCSSEADDICSSEADDICSSEVDDDPELLSTSRHSFHRSVSLSVVAIEESISNVTSSLSH